MTQSGAGATQVVRGEVRDAGAQSSTLHDMPNRFWRELFAPDLPEPAHAPKDRTCADFSSSGPFVDGPLRPHRNRDGPDVLFFADQIGDHPMLLPNLEVFGPQTDKLGPPESASNQHRQDGSIALAARGFHRRLLQQRSGLLDSEPIASPDSQALRAFDAPDPRSQFGAQEAGVGCL